MSTRPIVVVQGASGADELPGIAAIDSQVELRFADSVDALEKVLPGAEVLLGWSFSDASLESVWSCSSSRPIMGRTEPFTRASKRWQAGAV